MDELLLDLLTGLSEFLRYISGEAAKRQRRAGGCADLPYLIRIQHRERLDPVITAVCRLDERSTPLKIDDPEPDRRRDKLKPAVPRGIGNRHPD